MKKYSLPSPYFKFYTGLKFAKKLEKRYSIAIFSKYPRFHIIPNKLYHNAFGQLKYTPYNKPYIKLSDKLYFFPRSLP